MRNVNLVSKNNAMCCSMHMLMCRACCFADGPLDMD